MTAVTADINTARKADGGLLISHGIYASATIYSGTLTLIDVTTGYLINGVNTYPNASYLFAGVAMEGGTCSSTAGSTSVRVWKDGVYRFAMAGTTTTAALIGDTAYLHDNATVRTATVTSTNNIIVGTIVGIDTSGGAVTGSGYVWVKIDLKTY
jgi:hypothetical protein